MMPSSIKKEKRSRFWRKKSQKVPRGIFDIQPRGGWLANAGTRGEVKQKSKHARGC
jgi:hypothetical protein